MKLIDYILLGAVLLIVVLAYRSTRKHMKGQGGCCGGGSEILEPDKKLNDPIVKKEIFMIEGMTCENCANRIKRRLNRIEGISAKVQHRKKRAIISYAKEIDDDRIIQAVEDLGYQIKKG